MSRAVHKILGPCAFITVSLCLSGTTLAQSFTSIDPLGSVSTQVTAINAAGEIVGFYHDGITFHGFLRYRMVRSFVRSSGIDADVCQCDQLGRPDCGSLLHLLRL